MTELEAQTVDMAGWTIATYAVHNEAMRDAERRFNAALREADREFRNEQDRRYAEVNVEKEKALKIKETADLAALSLARESQVYKDQQADVMREKNLAASGVYATNSDLASVVDKFEKTVKPIIEYVNSQQGKSQGVELTIGKLFGSIAAIGVVIGIIVKFL